MDTTRLVERKLGENHRHGDGGGKDSMHGGDYTNTTRSTLSRAPDKHSAENHSRKRRGGYVVSFIFSVYTATILFAVFITFTCAFLIVRLQELEVFLHHQDGYIRELRNQFEAGIPPVNPQAPPGDLDNRIGSDSGISEYRVRRE